MDSITFMAMCLEERREFCKKKIAAHTPCQTPHDELMVRVYQGLLELHEEPETTTDPEHSND